MSKNMNVYRRCFASIVLLAISACATAPEPQYYLLGQAAASPAGREAVVTTTVSMPTYLRHEGIALATAPHTIQHARFHRWVQPLDEGVRQTLRAALRKQIPSAPIKRLDVDIEYFHGDVDGTVWLQASWRLHLQCGVDQQGRYHGKEQILSPGYRPLVAAHQKLVTSFAAEIAESVSDADCAPLSSKGIGSVDTENRDQDSA